MTRAMTEPRDTPYLEVDHGILLRNLDRAATDAAAHGLTLRPHAKTHKSPHLGRLQLDRGAPGLTLATVSEAENFADSGFTDIFIAYPVWPSPRRARRIRDLAERVSLRLGIDSVDTATRLGAALTAGSVEALIEIDSGHHRSGVDPREAGDIAVAASRAGFTVVGVFTFPGHSYTPGARESAARDEADAVTTAAEALRAHGIDPVVRSGGSTPSRVASDSTVLTETRPGVYVFNDAQQVELGSCDLADVSLTARATVVSRRGRDIIVDAGSKALGADRPAWATGYGR
ncbi:MAG TPA: alanine racemase, partial [Terrimesophilobacter sp.]|nr:alanine racemase [Terrimesophilobacter sp.]